jgi:hypothetical protein
MPVAGNDRIGIAGQGSLNEAPRSKSPTRQSRYGDGALRGNLARANKFIVRAKEMIHKKGVS